MLPLLQWLDRYPAVYAVVFSLVALATAAAMWRSYRDDQTARFLGRWGVPALLLLVLLAGRWPQLFAIGELNPDSSQFLAGALTLPHDPVFWRSVDGMTAGPLIFYTLALFQWVGVPLTYFAERIIALGMLATTLALGHRLVAAHHGQRAAALAVGPATLFFALTTDPDFNHFSSELVPIALLAVAALVFFHPRSRNHFRWLAVGAFVAGWMPWAKLQAAPIAAAIGLCALVAVARDGQQPVKARVRRVAGLIVIALVPSVLVLGMVAGWHSLDDFYRSYVVQNLLYTAPGQNLWFSSQSRLLQADFATLGYLALCLTAGAWALLALPRVSTSAPHFAPLLPVGALMLVVGAICVLLPGNDFLHYTLLLLPGLLLFSGASMGESEKAGRNGMAAMVAAAAVVCLLLLRISEPRPATLGRLATNYAQPASQLGQIVRLLNEGDRQVGVWGWEMQVYVESGSRQATRSAYSYWEIAPGPQRDYFRQRYIDDLQRNRPPVFVDAVGEATKFFQNRARLGHETFPELAAFVARDYCLVAELRYARVYARRDLLATGRPTQKEVWQAYRTARPSTYLSAPDQVDLNGFDLPKDMVGRRFVAVMRPPAQMAWTLDGNERELRLGYGYLPEAEEQADGNGTELSVLFRLPDGEERVLRSVLHNPAHNKSQRGYRQMRVLLPPDLRPGSTLRLTTGTGPHGDEAWDWLYVTQVGFVRSRSFHPRQFPAFNRPPDRIDAPLSSVDGTFSNPELVLHAPARMSFRLEGFERLLQFSYGIKPGAFAGSNRTNGAIFRVSATAPNGSRQVLFERALRPLDTPSDRDEQETEVSLPFFAPQTELELEIDPNGSNAWDWTYISSLRLG